MTRGSPLRLVVCALSALPVELCVCVHGVRSLPCCRPRCRWCTSAAAAVRPTDLALRLARAYTGAEELLVLDAAYHGHTAATSEEGGAHIADCPPTSAAAPPTDSTAAAGAPPVPLRVDASPYKWLHQGKGRLPAPRHVHLCPTPELHRWRRRRRRERGTEAEAETADEAEEAAAAFYAKAVSDRIDGPPHPHRHSLPPSPLQSRLPLTARASAPCAGPQSSEAPVARCVPSCQPHSTPAPPPLRHSPPSLSRSTAPSPSMPLLCCCASTVSPGVRCESAPSCAGQLLLPRGYLPRAFAAVQQAGGVCIADEVQTALWRNGETAFEFTRLGALPDIVTLGKVREGRRAYRTHAYPFYPPLMCGAAVVVRRAWVVGCGRWLRWCVERSSALRWWPRASSTSTRWPQSTRLAQWARRCCGC